MKTFNTEPKIKVGIANGLKIDFILPENRQVVCDKIIKNYNQDKYQISISNNFLSILKPDGTSENINENLIINQNANQFTEICGVEIGINFHWNRKENQKFNGDIEFCIIDNKIQIINHIELENYIKSVISSEMNGNNPPELLKAHAIISRSWLMAQLLIKRQKFEQKNSDTEKITWYDKQDHIGFDVCADDHCQRYQGITRALNPNVNIAVDETRGIFLMYDNEVCDARFSKCCGGITEEFENCWQPIHYNYLESIIDSNKTVEQSDIEDFINSKPQAYCNTNDKNLLKKILNNYDAEYENFFRWKIKYTTKEISDLIAKKSGEDFGTIIDLIPLERGKSGRISKLKIVGTKKTKTFSKELEIRRLLSETHLYSSAFTVNKTSETFTLNGAGWGHGVGLCQIGAAVMAENGNDYKTILKHYFPNAELIKKY